LANPLPPPSTVRSSSASVTQYGQPCRRATSRIAASEYPASPAWKNGASNDGHTASTRGSIRWARATAHGSIASTPGAIAGDGGVALVFWPHVIGG
jgi:hypothetical protein